MKVMRLIWTVAIFLTSLIFLGYGIAFIGSGLSWWVRPEPDTVIVCLAFVCAGASGLTFVFDDLTEFLLKPERIDQ